MTDAELIGLGRHVAGFPYAVGMIRILQFFGIAMLLVAIVIGTWLALSVSPLLFLAFVWPFLSGIGITFTSFGLARVAKQHSALDVYENGIAIRRAKGWQVLTWPEFEVIDQKATRDAYQLLLRVGGQAMAKSHVRVNLVLDAREAKALIRQYQGGGI